MVEETTTIITIFIEEHEKSDLHLVIAQVQLIIILTTIMIGTMIIVIILLLLLLQQVMIRTPRTALQKLIIDNFEVIISMYIYNLNLLIKRSYRYIDYHTFKKTTKKSNSGKLK